jgi:hypothetical protein
MLFAICRERCLALCGVCDVILTLLRQTNSYQIMRTIHLQNAPYAVPSRCCTLVAALTAARARDIGCSEFLRPLDRYRVWYVPLCSAGVTCLRYRNRAFVPALPAYPQRCVAALPLFHLTVRYIVPAGRR